MSMHATDLAYNWSGYQLGNNVRVSIGDVDGDNQLEVLATCCGQGGTSATLYLFDWDGRAFIEKARTGLGRISNIINIKSGKITGRSSDDVIIITENYFFVYQANGTQLQRVYQSRYLGGKVVDVELKDVTGDGRLEIVVAIAGVGVQIYQWINGQLVLTFELKISVEIRLVVGHVTGSRVAEIVVLQMGRGAGRDVAEVFRVEGLELTLVATISLDVMATGPIAVGPLSPGSAQEIIIVTDGGRRILVLGWRNNRFRRITLSESIPTPVREMVVGDWDNGGHMELLVGTGRGIFVWRLEGEELVLIETVDTPNPLVGMRMADLNRSGRQEIVIGTENGSVHFCHKIVEVTVKTRPPIVVAPIVTPIIEPVAQFLVTESVEIPPNFPDVIKVASVQATPTVTRVNVIPNKVIISGFFVVDILVVVEPDRRVLAFSTRIPFTHFVHIHGLTSRHRVKADIEVVYVDFRFNPGMPRQIEIIIVAEIFIFDYIVRRGDTLAGLANQWQTDIEVIVEINKLSSQDVAVGQRLKAPVGIF